MCTIFGLSFPVQVRAQNLQELVYKQGSAGITKATVSIVFHNNDPANGPSGYEDKEYITVTRQVRLQVAACACWCFANLHNIQET
jgi:structural maintenance of chromosome 2